MIDLQQKDLKQYYCECGGKGPHSLLVIMSSGSHSLESSVKASQQRKRITFPLIQPSVGAGSQLSLESLSSDP